MPELRYYTVTRPGQEVSTTMRLSDAGVRSLRELGATVTDADPTTTPTKSRTAANKARTAADK